MPNKINQPFIILVFTIFFLALSYFFIGNTDFIGLKLKPVNLVSDLALKVNPTPIKESFFIKKNEEFNNLSACADTLVLKEESPKILITSSDSNFYLKHFFEALTRAKNGGKARVAYFGDSMIEGDLLTQDLRYLFQRDFGGKGVGFVPITSPVAGFRKTIVNNASKNWEIFNLINSDTSYLHKPGISGYSFLPTLSAITIDTLTLDGGSWAKFTASKSFPALKEFYNVSLFYGRALAANTRLFYSFGGKSDSQFLNGNNLVNELVLNKVNPQQYLTLNLVCNQPTPVYGLNFDSDTGVFVDNFAFRGNSGLALTKIPYRILKDFNTYLKYDLIVLQYGLNVADASIKDYSWYEAGMIRVINYLKKCFPQASFLVVSVGDKSWNNNGNYETDPSIPILVETQKRIAQKTGAAFWNLYEAMGGYNSMVNWAQGDTVYANKDYTHLNHRGARRVARSLYHHLMQEYSLYKSAEASTKFQKQAFSNQSLSKIEKDL